jgi:anti-anti-sigma factor
MSDQQQRSRNEVTFVRSERSRNEVVLTVKGPLTDEAADGFRLQFDGLAAGGWPIVTLDLTAVKAISSQCLGKIVMLMKRLEESRRKLRIRGCDPDLYAQFTRVRFDRIIDISREV